MLKFPMRIGLTWSEQIKFQPPGTQLRSEEVQYEVQSFEKIKTPKGEFNAFKLVMTINALQDARTKAGARTEVRTHTYYYAPDVKAIAAFQTSATELNTSMLIDSYSVQSENLSLTYSCRQKVDDFLNGVIRSAIRGL